MALLQSRLIFYKASDVFFCLLSISTLTLDFFSWVSSMIIVKKIAVFYDSAEICLPD